MLYADHWSSDRYNLVGWLFLAVLAGMGAGLLVRLRGGRAVTAAVLLLLACAQALGIVRDYHCRQDWRRVAEAPSVPCCGSSASARYSFRDLSGKAEVSMPLKQMPFGKVFGVKNLAGQLLYLLELAKERPSTPVK